MVGRTQSQDELWKQYFDLIEGDLSQLKFLDGDFLSIIQERVREAGICFAAGANLAVIVLCVSALEGVLQKCARQHPEIFNCSPGAPKHQKGRIKWSMESLINVSCATGLLQKDIKEFSKMLVKYRNYIHPDEQVKAGVTLTKETAQMCVQTLIVAISSMKKSRFNKD